MSEPLSAAIVLGLLGLVFGSFVAAVSVRLPRETDIVAAPSACMRCERPLKPWHLVPVVSWLMLRGRCGFCREPISPRYPLVELACAGLGAWAGWHGAPSWLLAGATAVLAWQLVLIALIDGEHFWLPDELTWPLAATGLLANALILRGWPVDAMIGMTAGFVLLWGIGRLYQQVRGREGLGGGDPFLFAAAGAWVGWQSLPSVLVWSCAAAFSVVAARLILRKTVSGADRLPFGVFLAIGIWLVWLLGPLGLAA